MSQEEVELGAMSQEEVELVRRLYAEEGSLGVVVNPDDERAVLDRLFRDYYEEQFEVRMPPDYPEGEQVLRGREGMSRLSAMLRDTWSEFRFEPERVLDAGDRVVVLVRVVAEGGVSGVPTERETAHVWTARHGRLSSIQIYRDRAEALKAAGLEG
jgi:ketosteroid isomerase-like protein